VISGPLQSLKSLMTLQSILESVDSPRHCLEASVSRLVWAIPAPIGAAISTGQQKFCGERSIRIEDLVIVHVSKVNVFAPPVYQCSDIRNAALWRNRSNRRTKTEASTSHLTGFEARLY
jgi:hypothetical protein